MAHELYTRTNQKIYFAGLALENWRRAEEKGAMNAPGLIQAEREASLFHLYGALPATTGCPARPRPGWRCCWCVRRTAYRRARSWPS